MLHQRTLAGEGLAPVWHVTMLGAEAAPSGSWVLRGITGNERYVERAPEHASAFDDLLAALQATPEWAHVDREVEVRLSR